MRAIVSTIRDEPNGPFQETFRAKINDPVLGTALQTMAALLLGIVFLMTNKPPLVGAVVTIVIAMVIGLVSGVLLWSGGNGRMGQRSGELL